MKPWPRRTEQKLADGTETETLDTGLYLRTRTSKRVSLPTKFPGPPDPLGTLTEMDAAVHDALGTWPDYLQRAGRRLRDEIHLAVHSIREGNTADAAERCLRIGADWEMLRVSEAEEEFRSMRNIIEASRGTRRARAGTVRDSLQTVAGWQDMPDLKLRRLLKNKLPKLTDDCLAHEVRRLKKAVTKA